MVYAELHVPYGPSPAFGAFEFEDSDEYEIDILDHSFLTLMSSLQASSRSPAFARNSSLMHMFFRDPSGTARVMGPSVVF